MKKKDEGKPAPTKKRGFRASRAMNLARSLSTRTTIVLETVKEQQQLVIPTKQTCLVLSKNQHLF